MESKQPENEQKQNEGGEEQEGEEILDDDYLLQLHKYLQEMKNARKQAEQDANLLDGRLRCLRDEEKKTLKKIEVTRKKTENKMNQLQQQEEELRKKMEFRNKKQQELERLRQQNEIQKGTRNSQIYRTIDDYMALIKKRIKKKGEIDDIIQIIQNFIYRQIHKYIFPKIILKEDIDFYIKCS